MSKHDDLARQVRDLGLQVNRLQAQVNTSASYSDLRLAFERIRKLENQPCPPQPRLMARFVGGPWNGQERPMSSLPLHYNVPLPSASEAYAAWVAGAAYSYPKLREGRYVWIAKGYEGQHVGIYEYRGEC